MGSSRTRVASIVGEARVLKREAQHGGRAWQPCDRGAHPSIFWHPSRALTVNSSRALRENCLSDSSCLSEVQSCTYVGPSRRSTSS